MSMSRGFQRAIFNQSTAARHQVIGPPATNKKIRIRGLFLTAAGAQQVTLESAAVSLGTINLSANNSITMPPLDGGVGEAWLECAKGAALNITLGQAVQTDGVILYDIIQ